MRTDCVLDALEQPLYVRQPERDGSLVCHSDRGSQYVSIRHTERLVETINTLYKAKLIHRSAPLKTKESVELATRKWVGKCTRCAAGLRPSRDQQRTTLSAAGSMLHHTHRSDPARVLAKDSASVPPTVLRPWLPSSGPAAASGTAHESSSTDATPVGPSGQAALTVLAAVRR